MFFPHYFYLIFFVGEKQYPGSSTSSEEDLLSSEMTDVEEQLAQSPSVNSDTGFDEDNGKKICDPGSNL